MLSSGKETTLGTAPTSYIWAVSAEAQSTNSTPLSVMVRMPWSLRDPKTIDEMTSSRDSIPDGVAVLDGVLMCSSGRVSCTQD
jgi:hypothetical protein